VLTRWLSPFNLEFALWRLISVHARASGASTNEKL
jgi:hypothetical protein